jgi:hypothetical protein
MSRATAKRADARRYAEHFGPGDRLVWDSLPLVREGGAFVPAPSILGTVAWSVNEHAFVRFFLGGKLGEPKEVVAQQPCNMEEDP